MTILKTETPIPDKVISLKRVGGYQLEAHLEGSAVFPVVIDFDGTSQHLAWDSFRSCLMLWETEISQPIAHGLSRAWASAISHPSFGKLK